MSDFCRITKSGLVEFKWHDGSYVSRTPSNVFSVLRCKCELEEGITLLDIFELVETYPELKQFISAYSWCRSIDEFHERAHGEGELYDDIKFLEVYRTVDIFDDEMSLDLGFHGVGKDGTMFSVSCCPMENIANFPVLLNEEVDFAFFMGIVNGDVKDSVEFLKKIKQDGPKSVNLKKSFSLLDVLEAIYWDISFYGGPDETVAFFEEMTKRAERVDEFYELEELEDIIGGKNVKE